jgi:hypothetical protein
MSRLTTLTSTTDTPTFLSAIQTFLASPYISVSQFIGILFNDLEEKRRVVAVLVGKGLREGVNDGGEFVIYRMVVCVFLIVHDQTMY